MPSMVSSSFCRLEPSSTAITASLPSVADYDLMLGLSRTVKGPKTASFEYRRTKAGLNAEIAGPGKGGKEIVIPFDYLQRK